MKDHRLVAELFSLLGEDGLIRLAEEFGGIRLYVPSAGETSQVTNVLGSEIANQLSQHYERNYIGVPLMREMRARRYRDEGLSNAKIARKLGITENGVVKLFMRQPVKYRIKRLDSRQIEMFPRDTSDT